jgi:hypothetical protein
VTQSQNATGKHAEGDWVLKHNLSARKAFANVISGIRIGRQDGRKQLKHDVAYGERFEQSERQEHKQQAEKPAHHLLEVFGIANEAAR